MLRPLIKVRDKQSGKVHTVGENIHDTLLIHNGSIQYYNLQNGEGTGNDPRCEYEFISYVEDDYEKYIEFVNDEKWEKLCLKKSIELDHARDRLLKKVFELEDKEKVQSVGAEQDS